MNDKIKQLISNKYFVLMIILCVGIFLFALSGTYSPKSENVFNQEYVFNLEKRIKSIIETIENVGECEVMINCVLNDNDNIDVKGAVVTCNGGNLPSVKESVTNAVCALLGIGANDVCVISKK